MNRGVVPQTPLHNCTMKIRRTCKGKGKYAFARPRTASHESNCRVQNRPESAAFPSLRPDYIHPPNRHEQILLDSGTSKNLFRADFTRLTTIHAHNKPRQKMTFQKGGTITSIQDVEEPFREKPSVHSSVGTRDQAHAPAIVDLLWWAGGDLNSVGP